MKNQYHFQLPSMKKIAITLSLLLLVCFGQAWAQTTSAPVFSLPIAPGTSAYVDMDVYNHYPFINQIGIAASPTGGNLMVAAAMGGQAYPQNELSIRPVSYCDSYPPCPGEEIGILIDHGFGLFTIYSGLDSASLANSGISAGDYVYAGQPLALAGTDPGTGQSRFDFEAMVIQHPDSNPPYGGVIPRDIQLIIDRSGKVSLYDANNFIPMFGFATGNRTLYAGEWISVPGGTSATGGRKVAAAQEEVSIFPNPNNGNATLRIGLEKASNVSLQIMDLKGSILAMPISQQSLQSGLHEIQLDFNQLPNGLYVYRVLTNSQVFNGKIQVLH
jgi:hypothetical protein